MRVQGPGMRGRKKGENQWKNPSLSWQPQQESGCLIIWDLLRSFTERNWDPSAPAKKGGNVYASALTLPSELLLCDRWAHSLGVSSQEGAGEAWGRKLTTAGADTGSEPRGAQTEWTGFARNAPEGRLCASRPNSRDQWCPISSLKLATWEYFHMEMGKSCTSGFLPPPPQQLWNIS